MSEIQHKLREQWMTEQALIQLDLSALGWGVEVLEWKAKFPRRRVLLQSWLLR